MIPGLGGPWSAPPCRRVVPAGPSGMGLSPAASGEFGIRLSRVPWPRPTQISKTSSTESSDTQSATGQSTVPHSDSASSQALLVQFLPKQLKQDRRLEQARSFQQGEKPETSLELTPSKKRTELIPTSNSEIESTQKNQAVEGNPRPRPGDLIEIFRIGYEHWAIYVEDDCVVHLAPPSEFEAGSITSIFSNRAVVKYSRLEDVLHGCSWKINNKLDGTYLPLPVDKIMQRTKNMINKIVQYSLIEGNCEHFVNDLRYGVPRSQQVYFVELGNHRKHSENLLRTFPVMKNSPQKLFLLFSAISAFLHISQSCLFRPTVSLGGGGVRGHQGKLRLQGQLDFNLAGEVAQWLRALATL